MSKMYVVVCLLGMLLTSACYTTVGTAGKSGKVPPGQAKKAAGAKSAKDFAPGHNKY